MAFPLSFSDCYFILTCFCELPVQVLTWVDFDDVQLLLALVRGNRPDNSTVDRHIALNDAHQLNKVFIGKVSKEDTLIRIFCTRSQQQLTATLNYYHQHYGQEFEQVGHSVIFFDLSLDLPCSLVSPVSVVFGIIVGDDHNMLKFRGRVCSPYLGRTLEISNKRCDTL